MTSASDGALYDGTDLVALVDDDVKEYTVKEGTTRIMDGAFYNKMNLGKVRLPHSLEIIGCDAFKRSGIKTIDIPDSVRCIKDEAFKNCKLLKRLDIPEGILVWGVSVFAGCEALETVTLPDDMYQIPTWTFYFDRNLKEIKFPSNLLSIGGYAFGMCLALENVDLPEKLVLIDVAAFANCALKKITFPQKLKKIDGRCFQGCNSLSGIIIPQNISFIGLQAFEKCAAPEVYIMCNDVKNRADKQFVDAITGNNRYYYNGQIKELKQVQ